MPKKNFHRRLHQAHGKPVHIKSVLLENGNLVIPKIMKRKKPMVACWVEVEPGTSDYKRWYPVHEKESAEEPDPRTLEGYRSQLRDYAGNAFDHTLTGVYLEKA